MTDSRYYIGLISGTSVDGVDCVLVQFENDQPRLLHTYFKAVEPELKAKILSLCSGTQINLSDYGQIDVEIGQEFAVAVNRLLEKASIDAASITAIGSHGQTVYHQPGGDYPFSLQLGDPNTIAQLTGITTVADFRRRDMAAGGEGAPLAPLLHRNCFHSSAEDRVVVNIGGISNITVLNKDGECAAFDTGPGNVLMDYWIHKIKGQDFDADGDWARAGSVAEGFLQGLLDDEYFSRPHPKSTGRELFNGPWLEDKLKQFAEKISDVDVQATLLSFTASTIASDIHRIATPQHAYICGGGVHNSALMECLQQHLGDCIVTTSSAVGLDPDWVEAVAFAWMAKKTIDGEAIDTSAFTGARQASILGGIYQAGTQPKKG